MTDVFAQTVLNIQIIYNKVFPFLKINKNTLQRLNKNILDITARHKIIPEIPLRQLRKMETITIRIFLHILLATDISFFFHFLNILNLFFICCF